MEKDYAIVVGISHYPGLTNPEGKPVDLGGPDNDATEVHKWLVDSSGGDVPPGRAVLIRSSDFPAAQNPLQAQPEHAALRRAFIQLESEAQNNPRHTDQLPLGRRLYLYFSGHGFAPKPEEGALFTADASLNAPLHVYVHAWLTWFRQAGYFEEFVLWMDSCMNWESSIVPETVPLRPKFGAGPGLAFIGLAAHSKSALEKTMSDGKVHGVFTWTLLQGVKGGAVDQYSRITGESLRTFLYNAMSENLPSEVREANAVDVTPWARSDPGIIFRQATRPPTYQTILQFPNGPSGGAARVWGGPGCSMVAEHPIANGACRFELKRGLYFAEVPGAGLRQGFEITGAGDVTIAVTEKGPAVDRPPPGTVYQLTAVVDNPGAAISVIDHDFNRVLWGTGQVGGMQPAGLYKLRAQFGRDIAAMTERIVLLDRTIDENLTTPSLVSPAPIPGSAMTHEYHTAAYMGSGDMLPGPIGLYGRGGAAISLTARYWTDSSRRWDSGLRFPHPFDGTELLDGEGAAVVPDLTAFSVTDRNGIDPVSTFSLVTDPGVYFLRQTLADGRAVEFALTASRGWTTQLVIKRATTDAFADPLDPHASRIRVLGEPAVFMRRPLSTNSYEDSVLEAARIALAEGRNILAEGRGGFLRELLFRKFQNPIAGILGAHLLIMAADQESSSDPKALSDLDEVISNLRGLVGADHPDVEALSLRCPDEKLRTRAPFLSPPLFKKSWELIVDSSYENPELVPRSLWERVRATTGAGAYLIWACDDQSREAHQHQLKAWSDGVEELVPAESTPADVIRESTGGARLEAAQFGTERDAIEMVTSNPQNLAQNREIRENARRINLPAGALADMFSTVFSTVAIDASSGEEPEEA